MPTGFEIIRGRKRVLDSDTGKKKKNKKKKNACKLLNSTSICGLQMLRYFFSGRVWLGQANSHASVHLLDLYFRP